MYDPITYRYPRTLDEAFPNTVDRAYAIERTRYTSRLMCTWVLRVLAALVTLALLRSLI